MAGTERLVLTDPAALLCDDRDCARCAAARQQRLAVLDQHDRDAMIPVRFWDHELGLPLVNLHWLP